MDIEILVVKAGKQYFGFPASIVGEVLRAVKLTPFPEAPAPIEGLLNLRGELVPVVSLNQLIDQTVTPVSAEEHFVVVRLSNQSLALRVTKAIDLVPLRFDALNRDSEPPERESDDKRVAGFSTPCEHASWITGVAKTEFGLVYLTDPEAILSAEQFACLYEKLADHAATQEPR